MSPEEMEAQLVNRLKGLKANYIKMQNELAVSVRKDVVAVELKDILLNNVDNPSLRNALEDYIQKLYTINSKEVDDNGTK